MKKYLIHMIYLLLIGFFVVYAKIKADETEKQTVLAAANAEQAERMATMVEKQAAMARIAENRTTDLVEELENCKSLKK